MLSIAQTEAMVSQADLEAIIQAALMRLRVAHEAQMPPMLIAELRAEADELRALAAASLMVLADRDSARLSI